MHSKVLLFILISIAAALFVACGTTTPKAQPTALPIQTMVPLTNPPAKASNSSFEPQTVEGGSVSVEVIPTVLKLGVPLEFEIAMNTHSVDLSDDMLNSVVLRDDAGNEYIPTAWDGPSGGGHHRSGTLKLAALKGNAKAVTLFVKNIAGVPERVFKWQIP